MHGSPSLPSGSSRPVHLPPSAAPPFPGLPSNSPHGNATSSVGGPLKRHGLYVAFYCKIMLYGINYTFDSIKPVKICFHVPFRG